jgi:hypothetical protein
MYENFIHNWERIKSLEYISVFLHKKPKKLHDEAFCLGIIIDGWIIRWRKDELKVWVVDDIFDFVYVGIVVYVFWLEAELEILIVEDADMGLRIILECLYDSSRID